MLLLRLLRQLAIFAAALGVPGNAQDWSTPSDWTRPFPPFKLIGNVYWVGTHDLSTYLITTPEGHVLINSGFAETVPLIRSGIEQLGFKLADVKILLTTHAHFDHAAGLAELKRMTGASMVAAEADAALLEDGGKSDFRFGSTPQARFEPVKVDRRLKDGDKVRLGNVELTAHHHPGHTKGATSYGFSVAEGGREYQVLIVNLPSINPGVTLRGMPGYPAIGDDYARTFRDLKARSVEVWFASHAVQFRMHEKYRQGDAYDPGRFVDPKGYLAAVEKLEKLYLDQTARERAAR